MDDTRRFLEGMNLPGRDLHHLPDSPTCFRDGALYRVDIPGVETPALMQAVVECARELDVAVHRITASAGITLLPDRDIREMSDIGASQRIEVCLAPGPRAAACLGRGWRLTGADELAYAVEDVRRAVTLGIRSILVADEGLLWVLREMKTAGTLPEDVSLRASAHLGAANPAAIWLLEELGAASYALPPDMSFACIAAARAAVDMPLEIAVEADAARTIHLYDVAELVRVAAPIYLSYECGASPVGATDGGADPARTCRERVRRARLAQIVLERYLPAASASLRGAEGVAMPVHAA